MRKMRTRFLLTGETMSSPRNFASTARPSDREVDMPFSTASIAFIGAG